MSLTQFPNNFQTRLEAIIPAVHRESVWHSFDIEKPVAFRINTLKANRETVLAALAELGIRVQPVTWCQDAYYIGPEQRKSLTHSLLCQKGQIYIQELSSLLPVLVLDPQPGEEILDLAAAPGSKTTQISCHMQNKGRIAAVEKSKTRFFKLKNNLEHQGVTCVYTYLKDGQTIWRYCENRFDRVLLDAPCSSEARFNHRDPKSFSYWSEGKIKAMSHKQWQLIYSAFRCLKPGGILVYSTCTFAPEENEAVINKLINEFFDTAHIEPITLAITNIMSGLTRWHGKNFSAGVARCIRVLPNEIMNGFFIAKISKREQHHSEQSK